MRRVMIAILLTVGGHVVAADNAPRVALHTIRVTPIGTRVEEQFLREDLPDNDAILRLYTESFVTPVPTAPALAQLIETIEHVCPSAAEYGYIERLDERGAAFECLDQRLQRDAPQIAATLRSERLDLFVLVTLAYYPSTLRKARLSGRVRYGACVGLVHSVAFLPDGRMLENTAEPSYGGECSSISTALTGSATNRNDYLRIHLREYFKTAGLSERVAKPAIAAVREIPPQTRSTPQPPAQLRPPNVCETSECSVLVRIMKGDGEPCASCPVMFTWSGGPTSDGDSATRLTNARGFVEFRSPVRTLDTIATIVNKTGLVLPLRFNIDTLGGTSITITTPYTGR